MGMEAVDDFTNVAWPTIERYLACHPSIFFWILSTKYWYALAVQQVVKMGVPKYGPMWSVVGMPKIPTTYSFVRQEVLGESHIRDLWVLIIWPEHW